MSLNMKKAQHTAHLIQYDRVHNNDGDNNNNNNINGNNDGTNDIEMCIRLLER